MARPDLESQSDDRDDLSVSNDGSDSWIDESDAEDDEDAEPDCQWPDFDAAFDDEDVEPEQGDFWFDREEEDDRFT